MTLTLLDLYNSCASQEWSMYDSNVSSDDELEASLVLALNKALMEILYSYPFKFRERSHIDFTARGICTYELPYGLIMKNQAGEYEVKLNGKYLKFRRECPELGIQYGIPEFFCIKNSEIVLYPTPCTRYIMTIDYHTLAIGENKDGEEIFKLSKSDDTVYVPQHLEEILKQAVIPRALLNTISSESDENYSAYKKQSETAYRQLVKYSKGGWQDKSVKI